MLSHQSDICSAAFSPDGVWVATGTLAGDLILWDAKTGAHLRTLHGHLKPVDSIVFAPEGSRVLTVGSDAARVWDLTDEAEVTVLAPPGEKLKFAGFNPDGAILVHPLFDTEDPPRPTRLWDLDRRRPLRSFGGDQSASLASLSQTGERLMTVEGGKVRIWDARGGDPLVSLEEPGSRITNAALSPGGTRVVTAAIPANDSRWRVTCRLWDATTGRSIAALDSAGGDPVFSPDGRVADNYRRGEEVKTKLWDSDTGAEVLAFDRGTRPTFSPDGSVVALAGWEGTPDRGKVFDARTGQPLFDIPFDGSGSDVAMYAFSPNGQFLAVSRGSSTEADIWNVRERKRVCRLRGLTGEFRTIAFSPNGTRLATGGETVRLWDSLTGLEVLELPVRGTTVTTLMFSPDGARLAAGVDDGVIRVWDARPLNRAFAVPSFSATK